MDLTDTGFLPATKSTKDRLIISIDGLEKQGKTHWGLTSPGPLGILNMDIGHEGVVDKFLKNQNIFISNIKIPSAIEGNTDQITRSAIEIWEQFKKDYYWGLENLKSLVVDTATEAWELLRLAYFGKLTQIKSHHYTAANAQFRKLIRDAYESDCNLILIHKRKKQYIEGFEGKANWNGEYERSGFSEIGFLVQVDITAYRDKEGEFHIRVNDCRQNAMLKGEDLTGPINTFNCLQKMIAVSYD